MELEGQYNVHQGPALTPAPIGDDGPRGVHVAMGHIEASLDNLSKVIMELRERLTPILMEDLPDDVRVQMETPPAACAVAVHLVAYETQIQKLDDRVSELIRRLAL